MINFILFHKNNTLPEHIIHCIKQIQHTQTDYKIHLLTDNKLIKSNDIFVTDLNDIQINELDDITFYKNDKDPLWRTSFERFFYIQKYIIKNDLKDGIHFDNDVLIYHNVNNILNFLQKNISKVGLTQHKPNELVCGFMYIKDKNSLTNICTNLLELTKKDVNILKEMFNGDMPHEMRLLGHIKNTTTEITILPGTPFDELFTEFNYVFDPSTYGQYFGGSGNVPRNTVHPNNINRIIDRCIINKEVVPFFDYTTKVPYITYNNTRIPIFNLHIHSKQLKDFITYNL